MRGAPAVSVRCTGGPLWRCGLWALPAVSAAVVVHWAALKFGSTSTVALAWALAGAVAAALLAARRLPAAAALSWDGAGWSCDGLPVQMQVMLDAGGAWLLLRAAPAGGGRRRWLAVTQQDAAGAWHALRAALYGPLPRPNRDGAAHRNRL